MYLVGEAMDGITQGRRYRCRIGRQLAVGSVLGGPRMEAGALLPGQAVQLTTNSVFYKNQYETRILSVDDRTMLLETPLYGGLRVPLNVGFLLSLRCATPNGVVVFDSEVLERDAAAHTIRIRRPAATPEGRVELPAAKRCRFIAVTSGKGGVGKTTFTINYAIALARLGKRVLLFDADLGMANVDVLLKTSTRSGIIDLIDGRKSMQEVISEAPGGIFLVAGGSGMQKLASLSTAEVQRIMNGFSWLESQFDFVLFDTGAGLSSNVTTFVRAADETIVITTPEPHAITDAYSIIKVILDLDRNLNLKLIVNRCENADEGGDVLKRVALAIRSFLGYRITPVCWILESRTFSRSIREQVPFMISQPNSDSAVLMMNLAAAAAEGADRPLESAKGRFGGFVGRLARLFG